MALVVLPLAIVAQLIAVPVGVVLGWSQRRTDAITLAAGRSWDELPSLRVSR